MHIFFIFFVIVLAYIFFAMAVRAKIKQMKKGQSDEETDETIKNDKTETFRLTAEDPGETNMNCKFCGKETINLSSKQICIDCLQDIFDQIQAGGNERKKTIAQIDTMYMAEIMPKSILAEHWSLDDLTREGQRDRRDRGLSKSCKIMKVNAKDQSAEFIGSKGDIYQTSLTSCTCTDFAFRRTPCKHIFRLADELEKKK